MKTRPISVSLPNSALPLADWADCYGIAVAGKGLTAGEAARRSLGHFPGWVKALVALRNIVVAPFGLKTGGGGDARRGAMIGLFPVLEMSDTHAVLGFDDRHLDFRIVIDVREGSVSQHVAVTTLVRRKIFFAKIYIAVITPFHRLIVRTMLSRLNAGLVVS